MHVRLRKARELLSTREYSITQIAQMVGFSDLPRFDKVFKRNIGAAPSVYRKTLAAVILGRGLATGPQPD